MKSIKRRMLTIALCYVVYDFSRGITGIAATPMEMNIAHTIGDHIGFVIWYVLPIYLVYKIASKISSFVVAKS